MIKKYQLTENDKEKIKSLNERLKNRKVKNINLEAEFPPSCTCERCQPELHKDKDKNNEENVCCN